tara:strand:+ start:36 stop:362 length:327 start_codon:yes stop_codon:yes gene_type:complete
VTHYRGRTGEVRSGRPSHKRPSTTRQGPLADIASHDSGAGSGTEHLDRVRSAWVPGAGLEQIYRSARQLASNDVCRRESADKVSNANGHTDSLDVRTNVHETALYVKS